MIKHKCLRLWLTSMPRVSFILVKQTVVVFGGSFSIMGEVCATGRESFSKTQIQFRLRKPCVEQSASPDAGRSECKFRQMTVTHFYLGLPNTTSKREFFLGFLFRPLGLIRPPRSFNKKASEKYPLFIITWITNLLSIKLLCMRSTLTVLQNKMLFQNVVSMLLMNFRHLNKIQYL